MSENQKLLALLIDGDNVNSKKMQEILDKVKTFGKPLVTNVYGNKSSMDHWEPIIGKYSLQPVWVPNNTKNKNSVDISLVVDAMALLYERQDLTGFCIVASDADYAALARQITRNGKDVFGIGEDKTPAAFRNACTEFIDLEELVLAPPSPKQTAAEEMSDGDFLRLFIKAREQVVRKGVQDEHGRVMLREIRDAMHELNSALPAQYQNMLTFTNKIKSLAKVYPNNIALEEQQDSRPVVQHYIHIKSAKGKTSVSEISRFRAAYKHAATASKQTDDKGWIPLAAVGQALRELYPDHDYLAYRGEKHAQMKKVVQKMEKDYPGIIELDNNQHGRIRIKQ